MGYCSSAMMLTVDSLLNDYELFIIVYY